MTFFNFVQMRAKRDWQLYSILLQNRQQQKNQCSGALGVSSWTCYQLKLSPDLQSNLLVFLVINTFNFMAISLSVSEVGFTCSDAS